MPTTTRMSYLIALLIVLLYDYAFSWMATNFKIEPKYFSNSFTNIRMMTGDNIVKCKVSLYELAAKTSRGQIATDNQKDRIMDIIAELEAENPSIDNPRSIYGTWDLIYTDSELILNSPFFMSIRELFGKEGDRAMQAIKLHRLATRTGEICTVRQMITPNILESQVELIVGFLPGIPFAAKGLVVSKAIMEEIDQFTINVTIQDVSIKNNNILSILDQVKLPINSLYKNILKKDITSTLSTYYLDDDLRITRDRDDYVFVYSKTA